MEEPTITLYTGQSPNGIKISILLEELNLPYTVRKIDMQSSEQKSEWFTEINPNGKARTGGELNCLLEKLRLIIASETWLTFLQAGFQPSVTRSQMALRFAYSRAVALCNI